MHDVKMCHMSSQVKKSANFRGHLCCATACIHYSRWFKKIRNIRQICVQNQKISRSLIEL